MDCNGSKGLSVIKPKIAEFGLTDTCSVCEYRLKHRLQLARRVADGLKDLGACGLPLQCLIQLALRPGESRLKFRIRIGSAKAAEAAKNWNLLFAPQRALIGDQLVSKTGCDGIIVRAVLTV